MSAYRRTYAGTTIHLNDPATYGRTYCGREASVEVFGDVRVDCARCSHVATRRRFQLTREPYTPGGRQWAGPWHLWRRDTASSACGLVAAPLDDTRDLSLAAWARGRQCRACAVVAADLRLFSRRDRAC